MKTAVIYARYSSDSQTEQSIEGQLRVCQEYAKSHDILIVDTYIDRAMTGTNDLRPDFQRMIADSHKRRWDYVLVYKLDRFSRDKYEMTIHKHTLKDNGVKLLSAMENIPDSPEGIILESLLEGMNQYYSAELSQKVLRGLKESYRKGQYTGGPILYGYDVIEKKNVINEDEAKIVREVFARYAQGYTVAALAKELRARGIRTKKGKYFTDKALYKMLTNSSYNGKTAHGGVVYDTIHPAIIDDATWKTVSGLHEDNQHAPGRKKDIFDFILSGKLVCGDCKSLMVGESGTSKLGTKYYYYVCLSKRRRRHPCGLKRIDKQTLEDSVLNATWAILNDSGAVKWIAESLCKMHERESKRNTNLKSLEAQRNAALKASQNLIAAIEQGIITEQTKTRLKELETQIAGLEFDIEIEKQRNYSFLTPDKIENYLQSVMNGDIENIAFRKALVKCLIREVILENDSITITYHFIDDHIKYEITPESVEHVQRQSKERTASLFYKECSYKLPNFPPKETLIEHCFS